MWNHSTTITGTCLLSSISIRYITDGLTEWEQNPQVYQGLHISSTPSLSCSPGLWQEAPWCRLPPRGSCLGGVARMPLPDERRVSWWVSSSLDLGRDFRRWLSRREPRVLSIQSQVRSMLWTSCMHWMYPVLYLCWASRPAPGSGSDRQEVCVSVVTTKPIFVLCLCACFLFCFVLFCFS